jgi:signal-transduction protein with cAMP-binding, CBS, and nucleotidyltransferase domain
VTVVDDTSDLDALAAFLATVAPLDALSPAELRAAAAGVVIRDYAPGEPVIDAFVENSRHPYIVICGEVALWTHSEPTNDSELDRFHPGSLIGFSAMLLEQPEMDRYRAAFAEVNDALTRAGISVDSHSTGRSKRSWPEPTRKCAESRRKIT